jgi:ribonuclease P protein component
MEAQRAPSLSRLTHKRQFARVLSRPPVAQSAHFAVHLVATSAPHFHPPQGLWAGVVLPKRWAKRAVTRNALRRQIYTTLEQHVTTDRFDLAVVVRLRRSFDPKRFISAWSEPLRLSVRDELLPLVAQVMAQKAA